MTPRRSLHDLVQAEAPLATPRALSVMVAVARELERHESRGIDRGHVTAQRVLLAVDGSVEVSGEGGRRLPEPDPSEGGRSFGTEAGASVGRLLFELLTGRPPLGRDDAFEPVVVDSLSPQVCALMARSCSDAPGQWPDAGTWRAALESAAGSLAPPLPPRQAAAARRRRLLVAAALAVLVLVTLTTIVMAPRWWDAAVEDSQPAGSASRDGWAHVSRTSS